MQNKILNKWLNKIHIGHALELFKQMPNECIDCVITSPPYWVLRDYGLEPIIWDAVNGCEHEWGNEKIKPINLQAGNPEFVRQWREKATNKKSSQGQFCSICGAWRGSLGLEPQFEMYISHLMLIFNEVKRVLKPTGCCFVNLGDTYGGSGCGKGDYRNNNKRSVSNPMFYKDKPNPQVNLQPKSLCQIPSRFAIAMTDAGWILRNEIIWYKRNCMPSSAKDRFTVDFEKVFMFVKNKKYYFKQQLEPIATSTTRRVELAESRAEVENEIKEPVTNTYKRCNSAAVSIDKYKDGRDHLVCKPSEGGRNMRTVWNISLKGSSESHFAVFPEALVSPMLDAGCPEFVCKKCEKPRKKIYKRTFKKDYAGVKKQITENQSVNNYGNTAKKETIPKKFIGYTDCQCNAGWESGTVLDPFFGAGTVGVVAVQQNKNFIGFELNPEYVKMANKRIEKEKNKIESYLINPYIEEKKTM